MSGRPPKIRRLGPGRPCLDRQSRVTLNVTDLYDQENGLSNLGHGPLIAHDHVCPSPSSTSVSSVESVLQVSRVIVHSL